MQEVDVAPPEDRDDSEKNGPEEGSRILEPDDITRTDYCNVTVDEVEGQELDHRKARRTRVRP